MKLSAGYDRLHRAGVIAVIRAERAELAVRVIGALLEGGISAVELTFTTPGAAEALAEAHETYGARIYLGAGTIREPVQVELAVRAGAGFLVTPHLNPALLTTMLATGLPCLPGVYTPSEVAVALDLGAEAIKLFPASTAGTQHLRALRGPFPNLQAVPTGGIDAPDIATWLGAGAIAIGAGSELCPRPMMELGRWDEITRRAERFSAALRAARNA